MSGSQGLLKFGLLVAVTPPGRCRAAPAMIWAIETAELGLRSDRDQFRCSQRGVCVVQPRGRSPSRAKGILSGGRLSLLMPDPELPPYHELRWPALQAVIALGGSATISEMDERTIALAGITEAQQTVPHKGHRNSAIGLRLAFARRYLKGIGALTNSSRGVWSVTEHGRSLTSAEVDAEVKVWLASFRKERSRPDKEPREPDAEQWKDVLIARLLKLPPPGFEQLAQRLLREAGFINVIVTGQSGDGGIDGTGTYRISLVSFPVYFQCKRYKDAVSASAVRDFRGAMAGKGEHGLLITTGSFTAAAKEEATKAGAVPIDLIDGERLCDLLCDYRLGVEVTERIQTEVTVNTDFFNEYGAAP